jgi:hypothetical protein
MPLSRRLLTGIMPLVLLTLPADAQKSPITIEIKSGDVVDLARLFADWVREVAASLKKKNQEATRRAVVDIAGDLLSFDEHSYVQIGNSACFQNAAMSVLRRCVRRSLARAWTVSSAKSLGQKLANS